jgi:hypothetical protein
MFPTSPQCSPKTPWTVVFLSAAILLGAGLALQAADRGIDAQKVEKLIAQLGSRRYAERLKAARALDDLGTAVLPALAKASGHADPEIRRRAGHLIEQIRKRDETEKLLAATPVELSIRNETLAQGVAELARKTGFTVALDPAKEGVRDRKFTLERSRVSFWNAVDCLCEKAQLVERGLVDLASKNSGVAVAAENRARPAFRLQLAQGLPRNLPTSYFLGTRVRALPPGIPLDDVPRAVDERVIALEISLDPARRLHSLLSLRVDKALDGRGAPVGTIPTLLRTKKPETNIYRRYEIEAVPAHVSRLERGMEEGNFRRTLLRVKADRILQELKGVLTVEVQKPAGPIFTADNILTVSDKSYSTPDGGSLTVNGASVVANGRVEVRVATTFPLGGAIGGIRMGNGVVRIRRGVNGDWETIGIKMENLKLLDAKGRAFDLSSTQSQGMRFGPAGLTQTMTLLFTPKNGQSRPARLVYYGEPTAFVDVPFTLKNVPLQ